MNCDGCKYYEWYYDHCRKWNCEVDAREIHNCFETYDTSVREKHEFGQRQKMKLLTREKLAHILRQTTIERDAAEIYKRLTDEKIPESERKLSNDEPGGN